ncbi:glyoxylate/hydroxypyruvate reductase B-like [Antedon mediterranea]|uniref:glyoxylate/hydroxypyruvate reductase B-like n=1 Tax=Antedon mediterranea TaxID=105859 RepID=UPI003AF606D8
MAVPRVHTVLSGKYIEQNYLASKIGKDFKVISFDAFCSNTTKYSHEIEGIIVYSGDIRSFSNKLISSLPNLKVISIQGSGTDGLDVEWLHRRNIRVSHTPHTTAEATADIAILLMLATARKLMEAIQLARNTNNNIGKSAQFILTGRNVSGETIGIIGMGNIGYCVAQRALGFRMKILYHNRRRSKLEDAVHAQYWSNIEELLKLSDFVVIATPLTHQTDDLIGEQELALMKPTAILINVARGRVVNTDALVDTLRNGTIQAAGLDVTEPEPLPCDHPLFKMENVIVSGHCGISTIKCRDEMIQQAVDNLRPGLSGGVMNNELFPLSLK